MGPISINREYFLTRSSADVLINLVNYLNDNEIEEEQLEDKNVLKTIIRDGMKRYVNQPPPSIYLDTLKYTILTFTMDYLKVVNLYRINTAVLLVGCVEYILFPGVEDRELRKIYHCSHAKAKKIYNKLRGFREQKEQNDNIVVAAREFFDCLIFIRRSEFLKTIRNYLRGLEIDSNELQFIRTKSIEVIKEKAANVIAQLSVDRKGTIEDNLLTSAPELSVLKSVNHKSILPNSIKIIKKTKPLLITREYLNAKCNAEVIINLQEYLIFEEVEKENLDDENLSNIIRKGMKKRANSWPRPIEFSTFKRTLLDLTPDYIKTIHLYRLNVGVLLVVCVEVLLHANENNENYITIYRCDINKAIKEYNKLCNLPVNQNQPMDVAKSAKSFFRCDKFFRKNEFLKIIRSYLRAIADYIDSDELSYVRDTSIQFIHDNAAKYRVEPTQNIIDQIDDH
ncbi:uncharacterized protein LOC106651737 isoform X1 [Trichogramma pretiosum]|uniref:uncharacterized protein LOC106651737 isoform X1 n=1 Tax=Trichogramma pretiosum TaxID=7493 RepID=UPI000C71C86A|nr:uncharacterized protein LOC106651737 isoform X1 [Trichogramma pretiosum]